MFFIFFVIKHAIIFIIKFSILEKFKFWYVAIKHFIFIDILNNLFYYFIFYSFCCYICNLYAYQVGVPLLENIYMGKDYEKCLDGVEKVDYHELLGQKKSVGEKTEEALAKFMADTANDPNAAKFCDKHKQDFEEFKEIPIFGDLAPKSHEEFVSFSVPAIKEAFIDSERTSEIRGHVIFLSPEITNGSDGITPEGKPVQYKTISSLHVNTIYDCANQYAKPIKENNMEVHIFFKKYYNQQDYELFKKEHPELFKNIITYDLNKEKPVTQEQTLKIIQHATKNKDYFVNRKNLLSSNSWFAKLINVTRKK